MNINFYLMRGLFTALVFLFIVSSCKDSGISLAKSSTFIRYLNDGNKNNAVDVIETSDGGYLILYNSLSTVPTFGLIKTDAYGNSVWTYRSVATDSITSNNISISSDSNGKDQWYTIVGGTR